MTPAQLGYRFPAEWERHAATWLSWPHQQASWPGKFEPVPEIWAELTRTLARFEPVHILAGGADVMAHAQRMVGAIPGVTLYDIPTNDAWTRDHGPMFLSPPAGAQPALVDWGYNAWGGKYPPFDADDAVPRRVAEVLGYRRFEPGIILEGGAIDGNGRGTFLTTTDCLLNPNRNPQLGQADLERYLHDYCGAVKVLWLHGAIAGDDTDGHVDQLARFVSPRVVVTAVEEDPADENYHVLQDNLRHLRTLADQDGRPLEIVTLPMPRPVFFQGQRLPAGYVNFYVANGVVLVPTYADPADEVSLDTLQRLFPDRQVIGQYAVDLILGLGAFHCVTQQQGV
jgi:agmatine deiminase